MTTARDQEHGEQQPGAARVPAREPPADGDEDPLEGTTGSEHQHRRQEDEHGSQQAQLVPGGRPADRSRDQQHACGGNGDHRLRKSARLDDRDREHQRRAARGTPPDRARRPNLHLAGPEPPSVRGSDRLPESSPCPTALTPIWRRPGSAPTWTLRPPLSTPCAEAAARLTASGFTSVDETDRWPREIPAATTRSVAARWSPGARSTPTARRRRSASSGRTPTAPTSGSSHIPISRAPAGGCSGSRCTAGRCSTHGWTAISDCPVASWSGTVGVRPSTCFSIPSRSCGSPSWPSTSTAT